MGWLHAAVGDDGETWAQRFAKAGRDVPMPEVDVGRYLLDAMFDLGPVRVTGMGGFRAADWPEVAAFAQATARIAEPWEMSAIRRMCEAYARGLSVGGDALSIQPMEREASE